MNVVAEDLTFRNQKEFRELSKSKLTIVVRAVIALLERQEIYKEKVSSS